MQRSLVKVGQHSLMAVIPSSWIHRHGLKKGDDIEFTEVENKLVLIPSKEVYERKIVAVLLSSSMEVVWRVIQPLYTSGYDEIKLTFTDPKTIQQIEYSVQQLIGFEIVETGMNHVIIKSVSKLLDEEFETILRRTFHVFRQMSETTLHALQDRKRFMEVHTLELTMNKYTLFLKRLINRTGYKHPHYTYLLVTFLELSANQIEYLYRYMQRNPSTRIESSVVKDFKKVHNLVSQVIDLFYQCTPEKFKVIAKEQPHFKWFGDIKNPLIRHYFISLSEYLVQMARQIEAINL